MTTTTARTGLLLLFLLAPIACASPDTGTPPPPAPAPDATSVAEPAAAPDTAIFTSAADVVAVGVERYEAFVFYLHGRIIEDGDRRPTHPEYGVYEYDQVLEALAVPGVAVISEARAPQTDVDDYATTIKSQVSELFSAGVDPATVTIIGFSKGGTIALRVSHALAHDDVGFVVLAGCGAWLDGVPLDLRGRMLSIHEASDSVGPCRPWVEPSLPSLFFHEVELSIGGSHGAFYSPQSEWLDQVLVWTGAPSVRSQMARPERVD